MVRWTEWRGYKSLNHSKDDKVERVFKAVLEPEEEYEDIARFAKRSGVGYT